MLSLEYFILILILETFTREGELGITFPPLELFIKQ